MLKLGIETLGVFTQRVIRGAAGLFLVFLGAVCTLAQTGSTTSAPAKTPPILGTIKAIAGESLTVASDAGAETKVTVTSATKLLRVPPGSKDLSQAEAISLSEFQPGERV